MSDEGDVANDAASEGGDSEGTRGSGGRTAVVTKPVTRPQRPTGKRSRQRAPDAEEEESSADGKASAVKVSKADSAKKAKATQKTKAARKPKKAGTSGARPANPIIFVYNYLKQVVAEMRKVIWPNRKQMLTYTSVVLVFLAFMVALVGLADVGLTKLMMLVFG